MAGKRVISGVLTLKDKNFASGVKKATGGVKDLEQKVKYTGNQIKQFGATAVSSFSSVAKGVTGVVSAWAGIASIGAVGSAIIETETAFDRLSAKTGTVEAELKGLEGIAKDVFKAGFGESIDEVTNEIGTLKAMFKGLNDKELKDLAMGASTISDLWGAGVNEVGKSVKTMTANFKGLSENTAMDLMTTAFQKTGDYAGDLLDTFNEYSGYFADMGMNAEEFTNMLIKGADAGAFNLDKVGDAIKELGIRAIDGSDSTAEGFKLIGLKADEMADKFAAGGDTAKGAFNATVAGLAAMKDPVKRNAAGVALFGTQWEDLRSKVVLSMSDGKDALGDFEGATKKAEETMHKGFGARMTSMWRNVKTGISEAFQDSGGSELLDTLATKAEGIVPIFGKMMTGAVSFANNVKSYWPQISSTLDTIKGYLVDVKDGVVGVYNFVSGNWSTIGPVVLGVAGTIGIFKVSVAAATAVMNTWKAVTNGVQIATGLLNGTLTLSPLGWVALAIGAVVTAGIALWQNWDTVKEKAGHLWDTAKEVGAGIQDAFSSAWDSIKSAAADSVNFMIEKINGVIELINKIPGIELKTVGKVDWGQEKPAKNALGSSYYSGGPTYIHERGGEIVDLPSGTRIYPHDKSVEMARNEGSNNVFNININAKDKSVNEIVSELVPELKKRLANM
ncbi:phage tail tape measure protein [Heyndrickxia oleronia]|uniref:phage tail tape measure protein n=1 Tax=Heyndrickxia oleronia TaxID=38875 RepID=UPI00242E3E56|nr:phage tail tape measure protein [Heyndrickxia oleronia]MCI1592489.1 phage tail tape measure protein [Heyndrickxia oleronia]MCI1615450.1 phage tail tape measure protein [Heyndrickxia oleronia]MCI1746304.1 phage tail tape measure protein [Heyndrickxia oleronia]MCI1763583.1 phage tail tape measure protein [Heyndrickxia oleronia]